MGKARHIITEEMVPQAAKMMARDFICGFRRHPFLCDRCWTYAHNKASVMTVTVKVGTRLNSGVSGDDDIIAELTTKLRHLNVMTD